MEKLIYQSFIFVHVLCGFTALSAGIVPMVAKKGGKVHLFWGNVYYWAMFGVFVTTIIFFLMYPTQLKYQFLLTIGIFSFYQTFSGKRILGMKKTAEKPTNLDFSAAWLAAICGVFMLIFAI